MDYSFPHPRQKMAASTLVALTAPGPTAPATSRPVFSCGLKQTRAKLGVPDVWVVFKHKFREDVLGAKRNTTSTTPTLCARWHRKSVGASP